MKFTFENVLNKTPQNLDTLAREVARSQSSFTLFLDLIGQSQSKRFYVKEIVWRLGFADDTFQAERGDDRKYVCVRRLNQSITAREGTHR